MASDPVKDFLLEILSPEKVLFKGRSVSLNAPGKLGYLTVLPGHADLIAELDVGELTYIGTDQTVDKFFIAGGFVDVSQTVVRVLADVIERPKDIDPERAKKSAARAETRLTGKSKDEIDYERSISALKRAQVRLSLSIISR